MVTGRTNSVSFLKTHYITAKFCYRDLHIIPVHLSRPLTSSTHPRLALSRLEMVEQLVLSHGISTDKQR